jgi:hypothetical protein
MITACFKNYVGTAPREAYQSADYFANGLLHEEHTTATRSTASARSEIV